MLTVGSTGSCQPPRDVGCPCHFHKPSEKRLRVSPGSTTLERNSDKKWHCINAMLYTAMASRKGRYHGWQASDPAYYGGAPCREGTCRQTIGDDAKQLQQAIGTGESWQTASDGMLGALYTSTGLTSARGKAWHSNALSHMKPYVPLTAEDRAAFQSCVCSINYVQQTASDTVSKLM